MSTRRALLLGAGALAVAGCSTKPVAFGANETGSPPGPAAPTPSAAMSSAPMTPAAAPASGTVLAAAGDIPVGGGKIFTAEKVVVTQPVADEYRAFSAVCTHVGCLVNQVANGTIDCPCHGSQFRITNGAVVTGPAMTPLPPKKIKVEAGKVVLL
ncbi:MAG TPA: Rieske (2Fe-2S) protein [Streptosporangiaceae bacterium]|jgi:Rieske Fe-S protein|nr:Rieske (2Fe-2S) protein [Streptosporangiaceae bacterium]